jgi:hypothetical protein
VIGYEEMESFASEQASPNATGGKRHNNPSKLALHDVSNLTFESCPDHSVLAWLIGAASS